MSAQMCHRCDVEMVDDGEWFTCLCCRSRTRGIERQEARAAARMAELGMNEDEYMKHVVSTFVNREPLDPVALEGLKQRVGELGDAWTPVCEHDTNPFAANRRTT